MKIEDLRNGQHLTMKQLEEMGLTINGGRATKKGACKTSSEKQTKTNKNRVSSAEFNGLANENKSGKHKYNAKVTFVDGIRFDSKWEANRYSQIKLLEKAGEVTELELQVEYKIIINDVLVTKYIADFVYLHNGEKIVEDAKGFVTPEYRIKKNLMLAVNGIKIFETRAKTPYRKRKKS